VDIKELLIDDATKKVYATNQSDQVIVAFNDVPAGRSKKKDLPDVAATNNGVSSYLFEYLESYNVPTYFVRKLDDKSFLAKKSEYIPIIVSIYNVASKSLAERFDIEEGKLLEFPIVEMYFKDEKQSNPMINEYHAYALGICERKEMTSVVRIATKVNAVLKSFFDRKKIKLINFQLQFSRLNNQILLADELSLDTINLWKIEENGSFKKYPEGNAKDSKAYRELRAIILGE